MTTPAWGRWLVAATVPALAASPSRAAEPNKTAGGEFAVKVVKDLEYDTAPALQPNKHKLDLYLPEGAKDFPVLFFIHGGAWTSGDRSFGFGLYGNVGRAFAKRGIGTVVISYRLSPLVKHPAHIEDVAKAFAWTKANIAKHGGRADQVFVAGQSAGGHLAALLSVDDRRLKAEGLSTKDIKGSIPISGVYRISDDVFFDAGFPSGKDARRDASPLTHVKAGAPPTLLFYAESELPGIPLQSRQFHDALKDVKTDVTLVKAEGKNHISIITDVGRADDKITAPMVEFIAKQPGVVLPTPPAKAVGAGGK